MDFGGRRKTYYVSEYGRRVGLLLLRRGAVLLVRQWRFVAGGDTWEIPGGRLEEGESPAQASARECWEETGWKARDVRPLVSYIPGTDIIDNPTEICVGTAAGRERRPRTCETAGSRWVPLRTCLEWVRRGRISCGMTAMALCAYRALDA
jgi:ADP-ribose pyrophosphatase